MTANDDYRDYGIQGVDPRGGEQRVICPRCAPLRKPAHRQQKELSVNAQKASWHCQHCGAGGKLGRGWYDDPEPDGLEPPKPRPSFNPPRALRPRTEPDALEKFYRGFEGRGIPRTVLDAEGVHWVTATCQACRRPKAGGKEDEDEGTPVGAIAFTYRKDQRHVHTKYRHPDPNDPEHKRKHFWTDGGTERPLYGYDDLVAMPDGGTLVVVEGEIDRLSVVTAELPPGWACVSIPDGAINPGSRAGLKLACLDDDRVEAAFRRAGRIVLATDADDPGQNLGDELLARCPIKERVYRVLWDDGINDANDCLKHLGPAYLRQKLETAEAAPVEGIIVLEDIDADILRFYEDGLPRGQSTGWPNIDHLFKILPGEFWVLHGVTGAGKSSWVNALLCNLTRLHGWNFGVCSPEWNPESLHAIALMETWVGKPFDKERYPGVAMSREDLHRGRAWLRRHATFINPRKKDVDSILERASIAKFRRGMDVFVIDPWTELEHEGGRDKLAYIDRSIEKIEDWARDTSTWTLLVCHQPKPTTVVSEGGDKVRYIAAGVYGAKDSASFASKPDGVIEYLRPDSDSTEVSILAHKVRKRFIGRTGGATLYFDPLTGQFSIDPMVAHLVAARQDQPA